MWTWDCVVETAADLQPLIELLDLVHTDPQCRAWPAAVFGPNGNLYVMGGYNSHGQLASTWKYATKSGKWSKVAQLPFAEYQAAAVSGSAGVVLLGGCGGHGGGSAKCPSDQALLLPLQMK